MSARARAVLGLLGLDLENLHVGLVRREAASSHYYENISVIRPEQQVPSFCPV